MCVGDNFTKPRKGKKLILQNKIDNSGGKGLIENVNAHTQTQEGDAIISPLLFTSTFEDYNRTQWVSAVFPTYFSRFSAPHGDRKMESLQPYYISCILIPLSRE